MATSDRPTAVIKDDAMTKAFQEGFTEGQAMATEVRLYEVKVSFEGTPLNVKILETEDELIEYVRANLHTPGIEILVQFTTRSGPTYNTPTPEVGTVADDVVVDAELL
jgi:hypothetical protein